MKRPTFYKIAIAILMVFGIQSYAQNYEPFSSRFDQDVKGDIVLIGNNILGPNNNPFNDNSVYNHNVDMQYIDIDNDATTFSSSSADLEIPNPQCYQIIHAGLYWGAVNPGDAPITNVKLKGPVGGYNDIQGTIIFDANGSSIDGGDSFSYACYADVTDIVTNLGTNIGTYTVANVSSDEGETANDNPYNGTGHSAGWSLFVVYEDPTLPGKSITSFDGFSAISVAGNNENLDIPVSGFRTLPTPQPVRANFAFATLEGDSPISGDRLRLNGVSLSTVDRPENNFFNSSVTQLDATPVNNRVPNSSNTLGFDTGIMAIPNPDNSVIANNATDAIVRLETSGDTFFPYFFALAVDIIEPSIVLTKIVEDDQGNNIGGQTVGLDQPLNYVIGFQNIGNDDATNFTIRDILPINIVYNHPEDLVLPDGVTVSSYDPVTRELIFNIDNSLVEENDPVYEIRIEVKTVEFCTQLSNSCDNLIQNQAFATYEGSINPDFIITDDPSVSSNTGCLLTPETTNFLVNLDDCILVEEITLCGDSIELTAADGYDSYSWSTNASGTPVIGTTQTITVTETGTYYVFNTAANPCQSIVQQFNVNIFGGNTENPVIPYADEVVTCPNDGKLLPNIFLCGANDLRNIQTNIAGVTSMVWEQLDENSCPAVTNQDCANEDSTCVWNEVATGSDYVADTAGQFRLTINYIGGCFEQFYFNVYKNLLNPSATTTDIICTTPGSITVNDVPSGYEFSIDGTNYQTSNVFSVNTAGTYTIYVRQIGVPTNPCVFTVPEVQIRDRDFSASTNVIQPICYDDKGSISLAANDADPQYFFSIYLNGTLINTIGPITENNYTFENLNPGTYTAVIETEDGCTHTEDITINEPPQLTVTAALTTPLTCNNGEITIYPEGGTPPYFYYINSTTDFQTVPEYTVSSAGVYDITVVDSNNCSASTTITVDAIPAPEFTVTKTDIDCHGEADGTITINVTNTNGNSIEYSIDGGATFSNSNLFTGLNAGDYDVVVEYSVGTSICATNPQTVSIIEAEAITGTATLTAPYTCTNSGTITVTDVTGGVPPYTYSLDGVNFQADNVFNDLVDGTYTITIKDGNDCTQITNSITIESLNPPTGLTFDQTPITCPTNTSTVTITSVTGGTNPINYQIIAPTSAATEYQESNTFNDLEPGTYTFQVRDANNCIYAQTYTIDPIPLPTINAVLVTALNCTSSPDAVISGDITGTAPYTYAVSINGGAFTSEGTTGSPFTYNASTAGTYQFQVTDANGCIAESTVITVNPINPPNISLVAQAEPILCHGDSNGAIEITIDNTSGTPPFIINVNNDTTGVNYGTQTAGLPAGTYTITVTDANSCTDTDTITINEPDEIILDYNTVDITCSAGGVSQGAIIINSVTGGTAPYTYTVTGTNGFLDSEVNTTGGTSTTFNVMDFGLYEITIVDANGCSLVVQDILVASPPTDLDINIETTVDCSLGGEAVVSIGSSSASSGPFYFSIYQGPQSVYPNPPGSWIPEDTPGSQSATFTGLTPGIVYTFIVYDESTNCSYYEPATTPIPTNSTLTINAFSSNNITCTGSDDGSVTFTVNSTYPVDINVDYEIFNSLSLNTTGISGSDVLTANGSLTVTELGPLAFGNYFVTITETSGPNSGCGIASAPFNITESANLLELSVSVDKNANCNPSSGIISAIAQNGTAPYQYQITTTATSPDASDANWNSNSIFNMDTGSYYVHVLDAFGCVISSPVNVLPEDPSPTISGSVNNSCDTENGEFEIDVSLDTPGIAPYSYSIDGGDFQTITAPFTISNLFAGTHTIEVQDANGCGNLVSVEVFAPANIAPSVVALPTCNNNDGEINLTTTGGSGSFTYNISPNPASITITGNTITGVPSGSYIITITDTVTTCTEEITVSLPEAIAPTISTTPNSITCFGDNDGSFEMTIENYTGSYTYEVLDTTGTTVIGPVNGNTSTNPITISGMEAGSFTILVNETQSPFCNATTSVIIPSPTEELSLDLFETSDVSCENIEATITAIASGGWGDFQYELTGDATVAYSNTNVFAGLGAGNYTVNVRDSEGCITSENILIIAPEPITATFTPSATTLACFGDQNASITVSNVTGGQGSDYLYTLNQTSPTTSTSGPQTSNVFNNLGAGTYSVTITDGIGCVLTSVNMVIEQPTPIEVNLALSTTETCTIQPELTLSANGGTGTYSYSNDSTFTTVLGSFTTSVTIPVSPGTYEYYVRDANNCIAAVSNQITINPLPELVINLESTNPFINCTGDNNGSIVATAEGGLGDYVYTLQDTDGNTINATQNSPGVFTELIAGVYIVHVQSGDCDSTTAPISIDQPTTSLTVDYNINQITCTGSNDGRLEINATGGTGTIQYAISPQLDQFFNNNIFENLEPDTYTVIVQDELGCFEIFEFTLEDPVQILLSIVPDSIFEETCSGDADGEFSIEISGGTLPYSVSLDNPDGPFTTGDISQTIFEFSNLNGGDHTVYVIDAEGCETEWLIPFPESITFEPEVEIEFACENNETVNTVRVIVDETLVDLSDLDYSLNGGPFQLSNIFNNVPTGTNNVIQVRHTSACIIATDEFIIDATEQITLILEQGNEAGEIVALAEGGSGGYQFELNGENQGSNNTFIVTESGTYIVIVTDSYGCQAQAQIELEILEPCIPDYFSPNGDGIADGWTIGCADLYPNLTFDIFDRYGRKIATLRVGEFWNGTYKGTELPTGDYWYVVQPNSAALNKEYVGHFTLYR